jgi:hypothetical protein
LLVEQETVRLVDGASEAIFELHPITGEAARMISLIHLKLEDVVLFGNQLVEIEECLLVVSLQGIHTSGSGSITDHLVLLRPKVLSLLNLLLDINGGASIQRRSNSVDSQ